MNLPVAPSKSGLASIIALLLCFISATCMVAQQTQPTAQEGLIRISGYQIDLTVDPAHHAMTAQAAVTLTALKNLTAVSFELNPALRVSNADDGTGQPLSVVRNSAGDAAIQVTPAFPLKVNETVTWTFTYSGVFGPDTTRVQNGHLAGVRFASIGEPVSYLLYPARWFPMTGYLTDRFTMAIHVHAPAGERAFGSGPEGAPHQDANGWMVFDFSWPHPGFPGTIIAGKFQEPYTSNADPHVRVYLLGTAGTPEIDGRNIGTAAGQELSYFTGKFGPADSRELNVIELPDDTVPAYWGPEIAAIASQQMKSANALRLLANTIAHQWWGNSVSPAILNDAWITNGMCRYAELSYLQQSAGQAAFADAILNISASALADDTARLADVARYPTFSPEFQAMTYDKGAMILRMLQWQIGDAEFKQTLRGILSENEKSISSAEVEKIAEEASHQDLRPFFTQWLDNAGAPTLQDTWTLYRLGNGTGYRTVGEISEDLDLFRMPVDVRVETKDKTLNQRVDVAGNQTQFVINTAGAPRKISLDPDRWLLRNDQDMQVRVHILRGQRMAAEKQFAGAIREYRQALAVDNINSLASYRLGELYFEQRNYQAAADAFRDALHGDGVPRWTEAWSDLELGRIFDVSGQRDRAVNQYRETIQTQDNTGGVIGLARGYLQKPYQAATQGAP